MREFKAKFRHKSGSIGVTLISTAPIVANGEECMLYSLFEITKMEKLLVELQNKNNELERFTYTASHDLKAPFITIGGFLGYLEKDIEIGNTIAAQKDIQRVMDAVHKMRRLLNELLEISRIGKLINAKENVRFKSIIKNSIPAIARSPDRKQRQSEDSRRSTSCPCGPRPHGSGNSKSCGQFRENSSATKPSPALK